MGKTRTMGSRAGAAAAVIAACGAFVAVGCGNDGMTPDCPDVRPYENRGDAQPDATTAATILEAVDERCLTRVQSGVANTGATGGGGGAGGSGASAGTAGGGGTGGGT